MQNLVGVMDLIGFIMQVTFYLPNVIVYVLLVFISSHFLVSPVHTLISGCYSVTLDGLYSRSKQGIFSPLTECFLYCLHAIVLSKLKTGLVTFSCPC